MAEESVTRAGRFAELLASSGLTVDELADRLGIGRATARRWGEKVPQYALAYLELLYETKP